MSKRLDENIGTVDYDGLIVTNEPVADVVTVTLAASQGVLARGTVITGAAGDETDTGTGTAVTATAYRTGHFARNKLSTDGSYTLVAADEEIMRNAGILLSDALDY